MKKHLISSASIAALSVFYGGDGQQQGADGAPAITFDKLPADARELITSRGITPDQAGVEKLVGSFHNANKLLSGARDVIPIPGPGADQKVWDQLYTNLGRPADPNGYKFTIPEGRQVDENFMGFARGLLHQMGVPADRAQPVVDAYLAYGEKTQQAEHARQDQILSTMKSAAGAAWDTNIARGKEAVKTLGLSVDTLNRIEKGVGTGAMTELIVALGGKLAEGGFKAASAGGGGGEDLNNLSAEQIQAKIDAKNADVEFGKKYNNKDAPGHAEALKEMEALHAAKHNASKRKTA